MCDDRSRRFRSFHFRRSPCSRDWLFRVTLRMGHHDASGGCILCTSTPVSISTRLGICVAIPWCPTPFCIVHEGVKSPPTGEIRRMHARQDLALRKALSAEIKARRAKLGLNQEDLAHAAGIGRASLARLESGVASPKLGSLFRLAAGLEIDPGEFVGAIAKRYRKEARAS